MYSLSLALYIYIYMPYNNFGANILYFVTIDNYRLNDP